MIRQIPAARAIAFLALTLTCCNNSRTSGTVKLSQDTTTDFESYLYKFDSSLNKLERTGFTVNPKVQGTTVFNRWKEVSQYHPNAIDALYIALGDKTPYEPYLNFSDDCWHFDLEAIEGRGSYIRILKNLKRISNGDLNFQNIRDYCNDDEDGKAWVSFEFEGDKYKWDLKVDDDWADGYLFDKIQGLCEKYNKKGRLTFFPEGQGFVISYLTQENFSKIQQQTGLKIEWLKIGNGQIY